MDNQTTQQKKDNRILYIILIWVGVLLIAFVAFYFTNKNSNKIEIDLKWNEIQFGAEGDINFTWEDIDTNITEQQLEAVIGVNPAIEAPVFSKFSIGGIRKYIPLGTSGEQLTDETCVGIQFFDDSDDKRTVLTIVSSTDTMNLQFPNSESNLDLKNLSDDWTIVGENRCKLYKVYADAMVSQYSYAIFEKDGHFWHIEFTNITDDEIAQIIYYALRSE